MSKSDGTGDTVGTRGHECKGGRRKKMAFDNSWLWGLLSYKIMPDCNLNAVTGFIGFLVGDSFEGRQWHTTDIYEKLLSYPEVEREM